MSLFVIARIENNRKYIYVEINRKYANMALSCRKYPKMCENEETGQCRDAYEN
jgi:hypothetical protein